MAQATPASSSRLELLVVRGLERRNDISTGSAAGVTVLVTSLGIPVENAKVTLVLPRSGASLKTADGQPTAMGLTDAAGKVNFDNLKPNDVAGDIDILVLASLDGRVGNTHVKQHNVNPVVQAPALPTSLAAGSARTEPLPAASGRPAGVSEAGIPGLMAPRGGPKSDPALMDLNGKWASSRAVSEVVVSLNITDDGTKLTGEMTISGLQAVPGLTPSAMTVAFSGQKSYNAAIKSFSIGLADKRGEIEFTDLTSSSFLLMWHEGDNRTNIPRGPIIRQVFKRLDLP
jgi:hypothetical protein